MPGSESQWVMLNVIRVPMSSCGKEDGEIECTGCTETRRENHKIQAATVTLMVMNLRRRYYARTETTAW